MEKAAVLPRLFFQQQGAPMTDDNSFKNNPFKALEKGRFPQQKKTGAPAAPEKRGKRIARQAAVPADDADASLFLSAMSNVERQSAHGGAARLIRPSAPRSTPPEPPPEVEYAPCLRCPDTPQSRHRTGPISRRIWTDFDAEADRSRRMRSWSYGHTDSSRRC